jgi:Septum formation
VRHITTWISVRRALPAAVVMLLAPLAAVVTSAGPAQAGPGFQQPAVGECRALTYGEFLRWSNDEAPVDCAEPHSSRVIAAGRLPKGVNWGPSLKKLPIAIGICEPAWKTVLGSTYRSRAMTAYSWGWFIPTKAQRERGARWIRCDVILYGGKSLVRLPTDDEPALGAGPHPDSIAACLTTRPAVHTTCARRHAWRGTGTFVMRQDAFPTDGEFRRAALRRCPSLVNTGSFKWRHRVKYQWREGDHTVTCYSRTRN